MARRPRPVTQPEVFVGGVPMSSIALWGDLRTSNRQFGDWDASWQIIRTPGRPLQRHPAFVYGAEVIIRLGPVVVWVGFLTEPDWDSGELTAIGAPRRAETALCLTAGGVMTSKPNTAIDQAIARGVLAGWTRGDDFGNTALTSADGAGNFKYIADLLNARAKDIDNPLGWRVDQRLVLRSVTDTEADPRWFIAPGVVDLGAADDDRVDRIFVRYLDSTDSSSLATASYPATGNVIVERGIDITARGPITPTKAGNIAEGYWSKLSGRSGWLNGTGPLGRAQLFDAAGPAPLGFVRAGDSMRLLGVPDARGRDLHTDVVIGEVIVEWAAETVTLNPVGLAASGLEGAIEDEGRGDVAL